MTIQTRTHKELRARVVVDSKDKNKQNTRIVNRAVVTRLPPR